MSTADTAIEYTHAHGAAVVSSRRTDLEKRLVAAREHLARVQEEQRQVLAPLDEQHAGLCKRSGERGSESLRLIRELGAAEVQCLMCRIAASWAAEKAHQRLRMAEQVLEVPDGIPESVLATGSPDQYEIRMHAREEARATLVRVLDLAMKDAAESDYWRGWEAGFERDALRWGAVASDLQQRIDELAPVLEKDRAAIEALRVERERVARHREPRIRRAEARVRRLEFLLKG